VAEARERDDAGPRRLGQRRRKVAPQPYRSEPFVQQDERRSSAGQIEDLQAAAIDDDT
jgi:hypothetical protein